jgi:hypothetical protein
LEAENPFGPVLPFFDQVIALYLAFSLHKLAFC